MLLAELPDSSSRNESGPRLLWWNPPQWNLAPDCPRFCDGATGCPPNASPSSPSHRHTARILGWPPYGLAANLIVTVRVPPVMVGGAPAHGTAPIAGRDGNRKYGHCHLPHPVIAVRWNRPTRVVTRTVWLCAGPHLSQAGIV